MAWRRLRGLCALTLVGVLGFGLAVVAAPTPAHAATTLVSESFTGTSVADSRFIPLGPACLTAAPRPRQAAPAGSSALAGCQNTNQSPPATTPGWLQLTDSSFNQSGGVLFNQALPSSDGLVITFDQAQYGGGGADGIGFFLADGAYNLTTSGAPGGALGYAQQSGAPGLVGGFLGVGLDAFGNFAGSIAGQGAGCTPPRNPGVGGTPNAQTRNSVVIRGPGAQDANGGWTSGYCLLQYQHLDPTTTSVRATTSSPLRVRVTVSPVAADGSVVVTVDLSTDAGATFTRYLQQTIADAPETVKFGFSASTGGTTDVHLVRDVAVTTVNDIGPIGFVKQENQSSASYRTIYQVGDTIPYQFIVTNPGSSPITDVAVTDPRVDGAVSCPSTTLAAAGRPGSSITCTGAHRVVAGDLTSTTQPVSFVNTATVTGTASGIQQRETSDQTVPLGALAMTGQKIADRTTGLSPGDRVNYTFRVTNTGSIPLARVTVTDAKLGINAAVCATNLAAGATATCTTTGSHVVTEQDLLAGGYDNSASFSGAPGQGVTPTPTNATSATRVTTVAPTTGLTLAKIADRTTGLALGSRVGYTFRATNTGNTTLTSLTVSDPTLGISGAPCVATLAPGVTADCTTTGSHTITEADIRRGSFTNTASATGTPPAGSGLTPPTGSGSSTVTTAPAAATLTLRKAATLTTVTGIGDVAYTFDVTNAGNITVSGVSITETAFSGTGGAPRASCPTGDLAPGATVQCTATYRVTQADIDAGGIDNTATATAVPPSGVAAPVSPASSFRVAATRTPALTVAKSVDPTTATDAGEVVTYSYIVTNTGNVTLSDPSITETSFSGTGTPPAASCPTGPIAPGAFVTCTADYELTQADVDAGTVDNTATATAVPPAGTTAPVSGPSSASVTIDPDPSVTVVKSAAPSDAATYRVGTVVVYSFVVTNTGNVTVTDPVIDDSDFSGAGTLGPVDCGPAPVTIAPTDQVTCEASYTLVQADIDAGTVRNSATVTATTPGGGTTPVSDPSEVSIPQAQNPALTVEKSADRVTYDAAGEAIGYEFVVTNTGNVTITGVVVDETVFTGAGTPPVVTCPAGASSLVPGEVIVCEASYDTVAADLDAASVDNSAVATGTAPGLRTVTSDPSSAVVRNSAVGAIALTKTGRAEDVNGNGITDPGDRVVWTITVRNTGATRLTAIAVDDPSAGAVTCPSSALAAGDSMDCTVPPRTLSAADATAGSVVNTAGVTARGVGGVTVTTDPAVAAIQVRATPVAPTLPSGLAATGIAGAGVGALTALGLLAAGIAVLSARRRRISD